MAAVAKVKKAKKIRLSPLALRPLERAPTRRTPSARLRNYQETSARIGFRPVQLLCAELHDFFVQSGIELYDYREVDDWLTMKTEWAEKKNLYWCWRPLRAKDVVDFSWRCAKYDVEDGFYYSPKDHDGWSSREAVHACRPYEKLVPEFALELVAKLEERFGDEVCFFVSDYAVVDPDPFIMVRPRQRGDGPVSRQMFIFGFWDEPGFDQQRRARLSVGPHSPLE